MIMSRIFLLNCRLLYKPISLLSPDCPAILPFSPNLAVDYYSVQLAIASALKSSEAGANTIIMQ